MCLVLHTRKSSVKDRGSSIQTAALEELLQNNQQQQALLVAEVSKTVAKDQHIIAGDR